MSNKPKTVKVRIAVAVTPSGEWNAVGWGRPDKAQSDYDLKQHAVEVLEETGEKIYFLEAELPLPVVDTVQARVEQPNE